MATKVYPGFAAACVVSLTNNSDIVTLNDANFDTWYEVLGMNYDPTNTPKTVSDSKYPKSRYRFGCFASGTTDTKEGGLTFEMVDILDATRLKISKKAGATSSAVGFYFLKNETIFDAVVKQQGPMPKDANGEVFPFQADPTTIGAVSPNVVASTV